MSLERECNERINSLTFNHDQSSFACCTENGVRIYNVEPLSVTGRFDLGGVIKYELLNPPNLIAIISGGKNARYCLNTVMIYDTATLEFVAEIVCPLGVKSVIMRKDLIIVVTLDSISIFTFPTIRRIFILETCINPLGLFVVTAEPPLEDFTSIIAFPGDKIGRIDFMTITYSNSVSTMSNAKSIVNAYQGEISGLAINLRGTLIASASTNGTIIRIWNTLLKVKVAELRRGLDTEKLYCMSMNFSSNSEFLCCSSDKGIIHIFRVLEPNSNLSLPLSLNPSIRKSRQAIAIIKVPSEVGCICTFLTLNTVVAICLDGSCHKFKFSMAGSTRRTSLQLYLL